MEVGAMGRVSALFYLLVSERGGEPGYGPRVEGSANCNA